jgi:hypothetical protein
MTNSVTFPASVGGRTYTDDANTSTGLDGGGHRERLVPMFGDGVALHAQMVGLEASAQGAALTALNAPATRATSTTPLSLTDTGDISLTLAETGKEFTVGMTIGIARTSDAVKQMVGVIKSFDSASGDMVVTMSSKTATAGPFSDWTIFRTATTGVPVTRAVGATGLATGGGTLAEDFAIDVPEASADEVTAGTAAKAISARRFADAGKAQTLTDAANIAWPITRRKAKVTLGGSRAMQEPTGAVEGAFYALTVIQDATGGRLLTWASCFEWEFDEPPELPTGAGEECYVYLECLSASPVRFFGRWAVGG